MILSEIKQYLITRQAATLSDMAIHFDTTPEVMRDMLRLWVQKGKVKIDLTHGENGCGRDCGRGCVSSAGSAIEVCRWVQAS